ncbi:MAG: S9 family peptidase [Ignavibacteriaceae bacterium]|nr:S9 family peptidase [Ignavibacteriaceae bacterium]
MKFNPPVALKIKKELSEHGNIRRDDYFWLNESENPKVLDYLEAENKYTDEVLKHTLELQEKIYNEIIGRIKQDDASVPYRDNGYYYYTRYEDGKEYPVYCRKQGSVNAAEEILLNVNEMAKGKKYFNVAGLSISRDNKNLSYGVDTTGRRKYNIHFKNLGTGKTSKYKIPDTTGFAAWANDNKTIFYTKKDKALRAYKIFKHILGSDPSDDKEIYHEKDESFSITVYKTKSDKYLVIGSFSIVSSEYRILSADQPEGDFGIFQQREKDVEYFIDHYGESFYIKTNLKAKNFRLMKTGIDNTSRENWTEIIPNRNDTLLEELEIFNDYLVLQEKRNGLNQLRIIGLKDNSDHYIDFDEPAYSASIDRNPEFDSVILRYSYTSLITPRSIIDYNMKTGEKIILKQDDVLGGYIKNDYIVERRTADAVDGTKIPISIVYKKGINKDGNNPFLLYGYGSYAISTEPIFSSTRLSLLDRGFIFGIAHIRGGQEMGRSWYDNGKLLNKKNTFTDFINCAEFLLKEKYTSKQKLCILGASAGGLLIGAVINMRPDLFRAAVANVPFVDVITTMLDESIPLTTGEFDEWGNPKSKEYYDYILSYSPYDNVTRQKYPAMLVMTGLHDSQVQYWEPAKWVAKLRAMKTDSNMLLLRTNMQAGHAGASGRFEKFREVALEYAFLLDQLNIRDEKL